MNKIYFISYYTNNTVYKHYVLSMINKIDYVINTLIDNNCNVHMISIPEGNKNFLLKFIRKSIYAEKQRLVKEEAPTITSKIRFIRILSKISQKTWLLFKLLFLPKNSTIIVYHSLSLIRIVLFVKQVKSFKVIVECEEIYNDIHPNRFINKSLEELFIQKMDGYIFSTELLNAKYNKTNKPYCILYGIYKQNKIVTEKYNDGKIHLIYSGTFDYEKKGAQNAIYASDYLDEKYVLHVIGFGSSYECDYIKKIINERKNNKCKIIFDGIKIGEDYILYLQKCHIGLSTQSSQGVYNDSSFPSKILTYFSNDLDIVSIKINVLQKSKINHFINYYDNENPQKIASAIKNIKHYDTKLVMKQLDKSFKNEIVSLINKVKEIK